MTPISKTMAIAERGRDCNTIECAFSHVNQVPILGGERRRRLAPSTPRVKATEVSNTVSQVMFPGRGINLRATLRDTLIMRMKSASMPQTMIYQMYPKIHLLSLSKNSVGRT